MPKMLLVTSEYPPNSGGVGRYYQSLVEQLPAGSVTVLALTDDSSELQIANCKLRRVPFFWRLWPRWGRLVVELVLILRRERFEWIAIGQVLPVGTAVWVTMVLRRLHVFATSYKLQATSLPRVLVFTHGMDVTALRGRKRWLARWILRHANLVVTNSQFTKRTVLALGVSAEKIHILTPCPAAEYTRAQLESRNWKLEIIGGPLILSVGRLVRRKGFDTVLEVFARVRKTFPNVGLAIIGDGPDRARLRRTALELGLDPEPIFKGALEPKDVVPWYARASVFLLLPRDEGRGDVESFGMAYLEANLFGVPVVAGRSGGVEEAVVDEETGFLVGPLDVEATAARVIELLSDEALRTSLGERGRARVLKDFQWQDRAHVLSQLMANG